MGAGLSRQTFSLMSISVQKFPPVSVQKFPLFQSDLAFFLRCLTLLTNLGRLDDTEIKVRLQSYRLTKPRYFDHR